MSELVKQTAINGCNYIEEAILALFIAEAARLGFIVGVNQYVEGMAEVSLWKN